MTRREFITLLGGAAVSWPLAARAQQAPVPVIGLLSNIAANGASFLLEPYRRGLKETGFVEGQNVKVEYRWADGHYDRLPGGTAKARLDGHHHGDALFRILRR